MGVYEKTELPMYVDGNVYLNGATPFKGEKNQLLIEGNPDIQVEEKGDGIYLSMQVDKSIAKMANETVDTELLGEAMIPKQRFENPDGSDISIETDFFGKNRNMENPSPGPFRLVKKQSIQYKVWPKE